MWGGRARVVRKGACGEDMWFRDHVEPNLGLGGLRFMGKSTCVMDLPWNTHKNEFGIGRSSGFCGVNCIVYICFSCTWRKERDACL